MAEKAETKRDALSTGTLLSTVIVGAAVLVTIFWTKSAEVLVTGHRWERSIEIQVYQAINESSWCDQVPAEAYDMRQEQRQRGTKQVQDGEDCSDVNFNNGDNTVRQEQRCEPRYRSEPTYDTYCNYTVNRWTNQGWNNTQGNSTDPAPSWPQISVTGCESLNCTRQGKQRSLNVLIYQITSDGTIQPTKHECNYKESVWRNITVGTRHEAQFRVVGGGMDCSSVGGTNL